MADFVTIEELRVRVGLDPSDPSKDLELEAAASTTLGMLETYLDRKLPLALDTQVFFVNDPSILLRRWPVVLDTVSMIWPIGIGSEPLNPVDSKYVDYERGIIFSKQVGVAFPVTVSWEGGFDVLPPDLMWAYWSAFDILWTSSATWGGSAGGGAYAGAAKRITLVGIGSVEFDTGSSGGSGSGSTSQDSVPWGIFPINVTTILDRYRRESVIGVG